MATKQMGTIDLSVTEARRQFLELAERVPREQGVVCVTKHGKPLLALTSWEDHERLMEIIATLDVMSDPDLMAQIRESEREFARGESVDISALEAQLARDRANKE